MRKRDKPPILLASVLILAAVPFLSLKFLGMKVATVEMRGVAPDVAEVLLPMMEGLKGVPLFSVDNAMVDTCLNHRWVACLGVEKKMPDSIVVVVEPRRALVDVDGVWYDHEGHLVSARLSSPPPLQMNGAADERSVRLLVDLARHFPDFVAGYPTIEVVTRSHWIFSGEEQPSIHLDPGRAGEGLLKWDTVVRLSRIPESVYDIDLRFAGRVIHRPKGGYDADTAGGH